MWKRPVPSRRITLPLFEFLAIAAWTARARVRSLSASPALTHPSDAP